MKLFDAEIAEVMTEWSEEYHPLINWYNDSTTKVTHVVQQKENGTLVTYRRDTTFAGNLNEALKVIGFEW